MREQSTVDFGFRTVREDERQGLVNDVFARVADRYDLMNDLMSGGLHRLWKDAFVTMLDPPRSAMRFHHLDVAGGTGDIAMRVVKAGGAGTSSLICDITGEMLEAGRARLTRMGLDAHIGFLQGNAECLPLPERSFDAYTIAFGIRNVTHIDRAIV